MATRKLFKQFNPEGTEDLNEWRKIFVDTLDPTEYLGGIELTGSWANWEQFKSNWPAFTSNILPEWHKELEIKLRSNAIKQVVDTSMAKGSKDATSAAKWLAEGRYIVKKMGAPTKGERKRRNDINNALMNEAEEDEQRLRERGYLDS